VTVLTERPVESPPAAPAKPNIGRLVAGVLFIAYGLVWMADRLEWIDLGTRSLLPLALVGVGIALMALAFTGSHEGLIVLGVFLAIATMMASLSPFDVDASGVGDRTIRVTTMSELEPGYELGMGNLVLDLSDLAVTEPVTVSANVGVGELNVIVPPGMAVDIEARSGIGEVVIFDSRQGGFGVERVMRADTGEPGIELDLSVGIGKVEVKR
jgi:hypothetical protein